MIYDSLVSQLSYCVLCVAQMHFITEWLRSQSRQTAALANKCEEHHEERRVLQTARRRDCTEEKRSRRCVDQFVYCQFFAIITWVFKVMCVYLVDACLMCVACVCGMQRRKRNTVAAGWSTQPWLWPTEPRDDVSHLDLMICCCCWTGCRIVLLLVALYI